MINQKGEERASLDCGAQRELWESGSGVPEINLDGEEAVSDNERAYAKLVKTEVSNRVTTDVD